MISIVLPILELNEYHRRLTDFAIKNLRATAPDAELVIVETEGERLTEQADVYVNKSQRSCLSHDMNAGIEAATQEMVIHTANDLVFRRGWVSALLEPHYQREDCGASTLLAQTHKRPMLFQIEEGFYGPVMCYHRRWRFDEENFPGIFGDTDMVMRMYREGLRMYRNWSSSVRHIGGGEQTYKDTMNLEARQKAFAEARDRFRVKHQGSGLMMFRALLEGWAI